VIAGVRSIQITIEEKVQTYMATKIKNPEYDAPLEVRYWRHPAELPTIREVENGSSYTTEVYTDGSKNWSQNWSSRNYICERKVGTSTEV
jgi:hypothetical protein